MEARKAENGDMESFKQKFLQSHFSQDDHKGFLEDVVLTPPPLSENITG